jgi:hypothetical protein
MSGFTRREFLEMGASLAMAGPAARLLSLGERRDMFPKESMGFLRDMARDVIAASTVQPGTGSGGYKGVSNTCGFPLITPGRGSYPAYWIRDFSMSIDSGLIPAQAILDHLRLTARCQNGPADRKLTSGGTIPAHAIPDHINYDGSAVFYPGTYSPGEDQGPGSFGWLPPVDDHYEFAHIAWRYYKATGKTEFLREKIGGMTLLDRLVAAFDAPATGLCVTDDEHRAVGFGFCDSVVHTGSLLFASLLRHRAARELAELLRATWKKGTKYEDAARTIRAHLATTFADPPRIKGWLMSATKTSRQADVWGTAFALYLGALSGEVERSAVETVADSVRRGTICFEGGVRHVPTDLDASPTSAWEKAMSAVGTYQNGAYWHTPTGWLIAALRRKHADLARKVFDDFIAHLRAGDYRLGAGHGAPWECFGPNGKGNQNPVYMASVALPYGVLQGLR